jgi:hypothetical protein
MTRVTIALGALALTLGLPAATMAEPGRANPDNGRTTINQTFDDGSTATGRTAGGGTPEDVGNEAGGRTLTATFTEGDGESSVTFRCSGGGSQKGGGGRITITSSSGDVLLRATGRDAGCP